MPALKLSQLARICGGAAAIRDRDVLEILQRIDAILRRLRCDVVAHARSSGSSQNVGVVWELPLSEISRLFATSFCVNPTWLVFVRSTSMCNCG